MKGAIINAKFSSNSLLSQPTLTFFHVSYTLQILLPPFSLNLYPFLPDFYYIFIFPFNPITFSSLKLPGAILQLPLFPCCLYFKFPFLNYPRPIAVNYFLLKNLVSLSLPPLPYLEI